jgi:DNA helicase-2/ATP-dependent DNA helicase PcrA
VTENTLSEPFKRNVEPSAGPAPGGIAARARAAAAPAPYLAGLNPEQRLAVETLDGPVLVLAGAGTGKTRVLTVRIAHILATGHARPSEILAVTFTNKAAREMKQRVEEIVGGVVEGMPWLGTFHSIGVKILRRHAELVGLKTDFTILDVDDQIRLIKQLLEAENIDEKRWPARVLAMLIDGWKNRGLTPDQVPGGEAAVFANGKGFKLYKAYQERLKILNAADGRRISGHQRRAISLAAALSAADRDRHSGSPRSGESGIHNHYRRDYGFRARAKWRAPE